MDVVVKPSILCVTEDRMIANIKDEYGECFYRTEVREALRSRGNVLKNSLALRHAIDPLAHIMRCI